MNMPIPGAHGSNSIPCFECHTPCRLPQMHKRKTDGKLLCKPCFKRESK